MDSAKLKRIKEIEDRLNKTTSGKWIAKDIPYDGHEDPCIVTEKGTYIAQTVYDMQSITEKHNVDEDTLFIAHAKDDIKFLLNLIKDNI